MWVLSDLFKSLPEIGDVDKPKLVFFFDEAHLLFTDASKAFLDQVEQTVKLIRSRGVGVFFCTQLPTDVPNDVLSQLGARIQHALRAFTPDDQKALTKTVRTYPKTDVYDLASALTSLGIGEAVVTVFSERGAPTPVAWTRLRSPRSLMASIGDDAIGRGEGQPAATEVREDRRLGICLREAASQKAQGAQADPPAEAGSKSAPAAAKKPGWFNRFVNSRGFQTFLKALGTEIIRGMFGGSKRRRRSSAAHLLVETSDDRRDDGAWCVLACHRHRLGRQARHHTHLVARQSI